MNQQLTELSEQIAQANDAFFEKHQQVGTTIGILDAVLRKQGMNADAVTIDCPSLDKKIVFLLHDDKPTMVDVAFGNKNGDINSSNVMPLEQISAANIVATMEQYFITVE